MRVLLGGMPTGNVDEQLDFCERLRAMVLLSEASQGSTREDMLYRALGCDLQPLGMDSSPSDAAVLAGLQRDFSGAGLEVLQVFAVHHFATESAFARCNLPNTRRLFHASRVENFVGILSHGLQLPQVVNSNHEKKKKKEEEGRRRKKKNKESIKEEAETEKGPGFSYWE